MPILFIEFLRAIRALRRDSGFVTLGVLLFFAVVGGAVVYWLLEGLGPLDALYLSVITLTTVGYGDPAPETAVGKIFTMVFVLVGLGILLSFLSMIAEHIRRHSVLPGRLGRLAEGHDASPPPADPSPPVAGVTALGEYDLLVVGSDEASRRTALEAAQAGLRVVLVEPGHAPPLIDADKRAA